MCSLGLESSSPGITARHLGNRGSSHASGAQAAELVGVDGNPAPNFDDLRRAAEEDFQSRLVEHLRYVYADVFSLRDPAQDEVTKIRDAFRHYRPQGMQDRMVRLFLGLCEYGGMIDAVPRVSKRPSAVVVPKRSGRRWKKRAR